MYHLLSAGSGHDLSQIIIVCLFFLYNMEIKEDELVHFISSSGQKNIGLNIMTFGDLGIGKTSLMTRFIQDTFQPHGSISVGSTFRVKNVKIDDKGIKLFVWDFPIGERFWQSAAISPFYMKIAHVMAFDVSCLKSFLPKSYSITTESYGAICNVPIIIAGLKSDLFEQREVPSGVAEEFASQRNLLYIETSAKTGENVELLHITSAVLAMKKIIACGGKLISPQKEKPLESGNANKCVLS